MGGRPEAASLWEGRVSGVVLISSCSMRQNAPKESCRGRAGGHEGWSAAQHEYMPYVNCCWRSMISWVSGSVNGTACVHAVL